MKNIIEEGIEKTFENKIKFLNELYKEYPTKESLLKLALDELWMYYVKETDSYYDISAMIWYKTYRNYGYKIWKAEERARLNN